MEMTCRAHEHAERLFACARGWGEGNERALWAVPVVNWAMKAARQPACYSVCFSLGAGAGRPVERRGGGVSVGGGTGSTPPRGSGCVLAVHLVGLRGVLVESKDELPELITDEGHVCEVHGGAD